MGAGRHELGLGLIGEDEITFTVIAHMVLPFFVLPDYPKMVHVVAKPDIAKTVFGQRLDTIRGKIGITRGLPQCFPVGSQDLDTGSASDPQIMVVVQ